MIIWESRMFLWSAVLATTFVYFFFRLKTFLKKFDKLPKSDHCGLVFGDAYELIKSYLGLTDKTLVECKFDDCF